MSCGCGGGCGGGPCTCYAPALYGAQDRPVAWAQTLGATNFGPLQANLPGTVPIRVVGPAGTAAPASSYGAGYWIAVIAAIAAIGGVAYYSYRSSMAPRMRSVQTAHRPAARRGVAPRRVRR